SCAGTVLHIALLVSPVSVSVNHLDEQSVHTDTALLLHLDAVEKFRSKLKYFFMSPCQKFKARGRKPWKLVLQVLKMAIITAQLVSFGLSNQMVVTFKDGNLMSFRHIFLKGYTDSTADTYAAYTKDEVYDRIYFIINQYVHLPNLTVGNHAYVKHEGIYGPLSLCQEFYRKGNILPGNETFDIDTQIETGNVHTAEEGNYLNFTLNFKRLLSVTISFTLKAINLQTVRHHELPDCYDFMVMITFDNTAHSGRIKINLENDVDINECRDWNVTGEFCERLVYTDRKLLNCSASFHSGTLNTLVIFLKSW
uniref:Mucolipin TRP cation channel 3 n=1 Tax=Scleropages formosus TaxID=113540 RepID=A0A8C9TIY6_SCLFO